ERAMSTSCGWQHARRDGGGDTQGRTQEVRTGDCGRRGAVRGRVRRCPSPCRSTQGRSALGGDDLLLLVPRRPDRQGRRARRCTRGTATAGEGCRVVAPWARARG